jgi:hypothetical protein
MAHDDREPVGSDHVQYRADVAAQGPQGQVPVRGRTAPAVSPLIHHHTPEVHRQIDPLLVPGGHVQAEPVDEQDHRRLRIARGTRRDLRPVEGLDHAQVVGRQVPQMGFEVVLVPAPDDRASHGARRDGAGGDPGADHRGALARHDPAPR